MQSYPLTPTQMGIYLSEIAAEGQGDYNINLLYYLDDRVDTHRLADALRRTIQHHPFVQARLYQTQDGEVVWQDCSGDEVQVLFLSAKSREDVLQQIEHPFDLLHDPLYRLAIYTLPDGSRMLNIDFHHIVCDGLSTRTFHEEVSLAYDAGCTVHDAERYGFEEATITAGLRASDAFNEAKQWYQDTFGAGAEVDSMPLPDIATPPQCTNWVTEFIPISVNQTALQHCCAQTKLGISIPFTTAFGYLLATYTAGEQALFATIFHGRDKAHMGAMGMFVKTLPVWLNLKQSSPTCITLMQQVQEQLRGARQHAVYSFAEATNDLDLHPRACFAYQADMHMYHLVLEGREQRDEFVRRHRPGLDLIVNLIQVDDHYQIKIEYNTSCYSSAFIHEFCTSYANIVDGLLTCEHIQDIEPTTVQQREHLNHFNPQPVEQANPTDTVLGLFCQMAQRYPNRPAVIYRDKQLTYSELDTLSTLLAQRIVAVLPPMPARQQAVVAILIGRSEQMAVCALAAQKAGAAYQPLDPSYPADRLTFMVQDSGAQLLICDSDLRHLIGDFSGPVIETDSHASPAPDNLPHSITPDSNFILLYTSGSTGMPKGVILRQHNLVTFCHWYRRFYHLTADSRVMAYASFGFDANMMDLYPALTTGAAVVIAPEELRLDLDALSQYMTEHGVTHSFMTTQVGYQFACSFPSHPTLQCLSIGGEKLPSLEPPTGYRFFNAYGPTECTIFSTIFPVTHNETNIPIGRPLDTLSACIVNPYGKRVPWGACGELLIMGDQVGYGYLNQPEKTAAAFVTADNKRAYKTGDVVRYRENGDIEFVGRQDGQVKIRGFRIELKEVESVIRQFPNIKDCTVQAFDLDSGGKYLAAYIVSTQTIDINALKAFIGEQKPPYMIPTVTMQIDAIPLNVNQKVDKKRLPQPKKNESPKGENRKSESELNLLEKRLCEIVTQLTQQTPTLNDPLIYCGLNSILAMRLSVILYKQFGIKLSGREIINGATLLTIENAVLTQILHGCCAVDQSPITNHQSPITNAEQRERSFERSEISNHKSQITNNQTPLSFAQQGVYADCLKNPNTTIYNIPMDICLPATVEVEHVREAMAQVLANHPTLFVHFEEDEEGEIMQVFPEQQTPSIPLIDNQDLESIKKDFVRPFDLKKDVLHRCAIAKTADAVHVLLDAHHLVADGASFDIILRELLSLLRNETIAPEDCTYQRFVNNQREEDSNGQMEQHRLFFAEQLAEMEEPASLSADMHDSPTGHIQEIARPLPPTSLQGVDGGRLPLSSFWFSVIAYTIARYTNTRDVYMATISNGRQDPAIADTVGMFINTLPVAAHLREQTIGEFLTATAHNFRTTLEHENYPFARIAADYGYSTDITYAYQLGVIADNILNGQPVTIQSFGLDTPKFKLGILMEMYNGVPSLVLQYDDALYSADRMNRLADSIMAVAARFAADPSLPLLQVSVMTENQAQEVERFSHVADAEIAVQTFHEGIARWATATPDAIAVIADDATLTYRQYNAAADAMAQRLLEKGVIRGDRIVLLLPRTSDFLVAVLAVMKCGAAYIPMDPQYPADRIAYILSDSQGRYVITTAEHMAHYPERALDIRALRSNNQSQITNAEQREQSFERSEIRNNPYCNVSANDLAYLIYTSGSTGTPKGVMLQHKGICNYLTPHPANPHTYAVANEAKAVLCSATVSFDLSILEYGTALFNGKTVVFANEQATTDSALLAKLYQQTGADVLSGTPSRIETYLEMNEYRQIVKQCKVIQMGGEKMPLSLLKRLQEMTTAKIYNMYGPTEITICCNAQQLNNRHQVTVGKPLPNFTEQVIDIDGNPLPVGVMGELIVSGIGVCPGYNNLPDKTHEAFIQWGTNHERYYRTGDYAQWTPQGEIVILGRTDHQVKLNGLRIELGEIETVMAQQPTVKQCVVQVRKVGKQDKLVAYYVPKSERERESERESESEVIRQGMAERLTHYMVPSVFVRMDTLPTTPAGKIDLKLLPEPHIETSTYIAPTTPTEQDFCDIFAHVLQIDKVSIEDDFFALGGTSLVAIKVVIAASKKQYDITYSDVFANPTPRQLAAFVNVNNVNHTVEGRSFDEGDKNNNNVSAANQNSESAANSNDEFAPLLKRNTLAAFLENDRQPLDTVLLTGATGYLGIHVLYRLLTETDITIYCPIRSKDNTPPEERLRILLFYYFEQTFDDCFGQRLFVMEGEVTQREWMEQLDIPAKVVINCLANVKHFSTGNDIEFVNVESVRNLVVWCCLSSARLVHISTTSVAGRSINGQPDPNHIYTEQEFHIGQTLDNQYAQAKYDAEKLILDAIQHHNLNAKILRVGNLSARNSDGEFQINFQSNNFMATLRAYQTLGACPYELLDAPCEFSPIDEVADAVLRLATTPKDCVIFHPTNPHKQLIGDVLREMESLITENQEPRTNHIRPVEADEFAAIMQQALSDEQLAVKLRPLMAYKQKGNKAPVSIQASNAYTTQVLHRLGFHWSITSWDYVRKFLQAISGMGYFD